MIPLRDNIRSRTWPIVNTALIIANAVVFVFELRLPQGSLASFVSQWGLIPAELLADPIMQWYRIFTSIFIHAGWVHFLGNMLYLYIFGDNVEDRLGHMRYVVFYLVCGVSASLLQVHFSRGSMVPMIGASGAIAGVLGAYFILYPKARVLTLVPIFVFIRIVEIPAFVLLGFWFIIQAWSSTLSLGSRAVHGDVGGVAWWAHSGGFITGVILVFFLSRSRKRR